MHIALPTQKKNAFFNNICFDSCGHVAGAWRAREVLLTFLVSRAANSAEALASQNDLLFS